MKSEKIPLGLFVNLWLYWAQSDQIKFFRLLVYIVGTKLHINSLYGLTDDYANRQLDRYCHCILCASCKWAKRSCTLEYEILPFSRHKSK